MAPRRVTVAVDVGSRSAKAAAFAGAARVAAGASAYEAQHGAGGVVKQDANAWYAAFVDVLEQILRELDPENHVVADIVLSGQMQCMVCVNMARALAPAILYADTRADKEAKEIAEAFGGADKIAALTGNFKGAASCMAKALWLSRRKAALLTLARNVLFGAHSFVAWKLTGRAVCDRTTAQTTSFSTKNADGWCEAVFAEPAPRELADWKSMMPELVPVNEPIGKLAGVKAVPGIDPALAAAFANEPIRIFHGPGDLGSTTLGAEAVSARAPADTAVSRSYIYIGTSGWVARTTTDEAATDPPAGVFRIAHPQPGKQIIASPMTTCGGNVEWIRAMLQAPGGEKTTFARLDALAASCAPGAGGVLYLPHPNGERAPVQDPHVRAAFVGISGATSQAHLARAVLEGVAFHLRWLAEAGGMFADPKEAVVVVGGGAGSAEWCQILASVLGRPVLVDDSSAVDTAVLGAATCVDQVASAEGPVRRVDPEDFSYDKLFHAWRAVFDALRGPYAAALST